MTHEMQLAKPEVPAIGYILTKETVGITCRSVLRATDVRHIERQTELKKTDRDRKEPDKM